MIKEKYKSKEQRLNEVIAENERLISTLSTIGDGVITTDKEGEIVFVNSVAETITGWLKKEAIGRPIIEVLFIINEDTTEINNHLVERVLKNRSTLDFIENSILLSRDEIEKVIIYSSIPIFEKYGDIIGFIFVFRDVTKNKVMEKELFKAKRLESLGSFAENIAHDFNNILSIILSNVSLSKVQIDNKDEVYNNLSEIENIVMKTKKITQSLLSLSKDRIPEKKLVSIPKLFEDSCSFILRSSNISYKLNCPDDLWPVEVDESQIFQVFNNLIINSMQAMPESGVIIIKIENVDLDRKDFVFLKTGRYIKISIKDQGTGISKEHLNKIFDPYFTTKKKGGGLGLAIVYSIIRKHDGYIMAESELKKGSTFTIFFPAKQFKISVME